jgi:hypothetical protein
VGGSNVGQNGPDFAAQMYRGTAATFTVEVPVSVGPLVKTSFVMTDSDNLHYQGYQLDQCRNSGGHFSNEKESKMGNDVLIFRLLFHGRLNIAAPL